MLLSHEKLFISPVIYFFSFRYVGVLHSAQVLDRAVWNCTFHKLVTVQHTSLPERKDIVETQQKKCMCATRSISCGQCSKSAYDRGTTYTRGNRNSPRLHKILVLSILVPGIAWPCINCNYVQSHFPCTMVYSRALRNASWMNTVDN